MTAASIPEGSVVITPTEMYKELVNTHQAVQTVSSKLDAMSTEHDRRMSAVDGPDGRLRDHENRIRGLERRIWAVGGAASVLSSSAAVLITRAISGH